MSNRRRSGPRPNNSHIANFLLTDQDGKMSALTATRNYQDHVKRLSRRFHFPRTPLSPRLPSLHSSMSRTPWPKPRIRQGGRNPSEDRQGRNRTRVAPSSLASRPHKSFSLQPLWMSPEMFQNKRTYSLLGSLDATLTENRESVRLWLARIWECVSGPKRAATGDEGFDSSRNSLASLYLPYLFAFLLPLRIVTRHPLPFLRLH